jgi:hypothetical protein
MGMFRAQRTALCPKGGEDVTVPVPALSLPCLSLAFSFPFFPFHRVSLTPTFADFPLQPFPFSSLPPFAESHSFYRSCVLSSKVSSLLPSHTCICTLSRSLVHAHLTRSLSLSHSFYRSCVLSSKHSHRSLVSIRIPRETIVESLTCRKGRKTVQTQAGQAMPGPRERKHHSARERDHQ